MNLMDSNAYGDLEIAGKMVEEHERKDQLVSVEVILIFFEIIRKDF